MTQRRWTSSLALSAALLLGTAASATAQVAIIVNRANPMTSISLDDLRRIFLGQLSLFPDRLPIVLAESPSVRAVFDKQVLGMNEDRVKHEWIRLVFAGEGVTPPRAFEAPDLLKEFVARRPGAIAFLHARQADATVKVLRVNGLLPTEPGYPIPVSDLPAKRP